MDPIDGIARRLKLKDLRTLQAIAETGSMARAAGRLAMSQAAVSKAIAEMERTLQVEVLERSARGVSLTEPGRILIERARTVFDEIDAGLREIRASSDPATGRVRIGTTEPMAAFAASAIERVVSTHPRLRMPVALSDTATLMRMLREREVDVVVTRLFPGTQAADVVAERLFDESMAVMASTTHPAARRRRIALHELMDERWTLPPPGSPLGSLVRDAFEGSGLAYPEVAVESVSTYMRLNLVASGRFLTVLPASTAAHPVNRGWLRTLPVALPPARGWIALLSLAPRKASAATRVFKDAARAVARGHGP